MYYMRESSHLEKERRWVIGHLEIHIVKSPKFDLGPPPLPANKIFEHKCSTILYFKKKKKINIPFFSAKTSA